MTIDPMPIDRQFFNDINGLSVNTLTVGCGSYIGDFNVSMFIGNPTLPHILIGRFCCLAEKIHFLAGGNHPYQNVSSFPFDRDSIVEKIFDSVEPLPYNRPNHFQIVIGHDVWIAQGVTIMGGVKIGNGAVIGANAVVAKDIPPYAIAVGNPARVIKYRFDEATIRKLLAVKWWNWDLKKIADNLPLMNNVEKFLSIHYSPEHENFFEDEFIQMLNNFGGGVFVNLSPISEPVNRCG